MNEFSQFERQDFTTDYLGDGVRYRLPHRQLGRVRHLGWIVVGMGLIVTMFSVGWMWGPVSAIAVEAKQGDIALWSEFAFGGIGLIILAQGLAFVAGGFSVIWNRTHCEIDVRNGKLAIKERFLIFKLRRSRAAADVLQLRVERASEAMRGKQPFDTLAWFGDFDSALLATTASDRKLPIAVAYPHDLLDRLAEELAPRLEAELNLTSSIIERDPIAVASREHTSRKIEKVEGVLEPDELPTVPNQPEGSAATIERRDDGLTIEIPPAGLWKGSKGLFFFAIIWNAFVSIFVVVGMLATMGIIEMESDGPPWLVLLIMIPFLAVGVGITIAAVNMGRRYATIATADDFVMIVRHSIFGKTTREWSASQIEEIRCGNSGMEVNDVPVKELQIIPTDDKKFGCLSQLDDTELVWIAAELNQALGTQRQSVSGKGRPVAFNRDVSGLVTPPHTSRVTLERSKEGIQIDVPPKGILKYLGLVIFGLVVAGIGIGVAIGASWDSLEGGFKRADVGDFIFACAFLFGFGGIGGAMMMTGLVAGRRRFHLTITRNELTLLRRGPLGQKTLRWNRDELESVEVADSGTQVNDRMLYQVFIRSRKGDSVGIMTGHDSADLELVAAAVKESLDLTYTDPALA